MRGLRKYLTPFAPDQSGAVSVFYEFGGIIVICDAGGCTGNICGFDEPRWFESKSALFSAGLRDMDAILGRDDRLVAKLADAVTKLDAKFAAIIGTPVPAVIGTDYHALKRMAEKKVDLSILTVDTDGMELYDKGEEKAWKELFLVFAGEKEDVILGRIGILGMTPQDISDLRAADRIRERFAAEGKEKIWNLLAADSRARVIAIGRHTESLYLPCCVQTYEDVTGSQGNVMLVKTMDNFVEFLDYAKTDYIYIEAGCMAEGERADTLTCDLVEYGILTPVCYENGNVLARVDVHGEKTAGSEEKLVEFKQNRRLQEP